MRAVPRTLADEILSVLDEPRATNGPLTISHLSRRLGVSAALTRLCAKQLIADGSATPFMVHQNGAETIQGLSRVIPPVVVPRKKSAKAAKPDGVAAPVVSDEKPDPLLDPAPLQDAI